MITKSRRTGFTLIELLVAIAIISLLIAMLLPSLRRAREQARNTKCLSNVRALYVATAMYVGEQGRFPALNNQPNDGTWQYNYLIWDGEDFDNNFGPLARPTGVIQYVQQLYCPFQTNPWHTLNTPLNPWPAAPLTDTRASYGRRHGLSGKSLSDLRQTIAFAADCLHHPSVIQSAHKNGVNVVFSDGHARWVKDPGILTDNDLATPFSMTDNPIMDEIWQTLDKTP